MPARATTRSGATTVWVLMALTAIVGVVAIGMDGGRAFEERRQAQAAADAAALAAGNELYEGYWRSGSSESQARSAALDSAASNGFANDGKKSIVTVNVPPQSGSFAGRTDCVEVIVQSNLSATFGRIFTQQDLPVKARSVAVGRPSRMGLLVLDSTASQSFRNRSLLFTMIGSPIVVNSSDAQAFHQDGLGIILADSFEVTGGIRNDGGIMLGRKRTGVRPTADPLRYLPPPDPTALPVRSNSQRVINSLLPTILNPGVYRGGIRVINLSSVIMSPGIYYMDDGGFEVEDLSTVLGTGVMIYNGGNGHVRIESLGKVALIPPLTGPYQGIGIFQDRASNQAVELSGFGLTAVTGLVYAPNAQARLTGLAAVGVDILGGSYIVGSMEVSGVGGVNIDLTGNRLRVPEVTLVE